MFVEEGERLDSKTHDVSCGEAESEEGRGECYERVMDMHGRETVTYIHTVYLVTLIFPIAKLRSLNPVAWENSPCHDTKRVPRRVDGKSLGIQQAFPPVCIRDGLLNGGNQGREGSGRATARNLVAREVEGIGHDGNAYGNGEGPRRPEKLVGFGARVEICHDGRKQDVLDECQAVPGRETRKSRHEDESRARGTCGPFASDGMGSPLSSTLTSFVCSAHCIPVRFRFVRLDRGRHSGITDATMGFFSSRRPEHEKYVSEEKPAAVNVVRSRFVSACLSAAAPR